MTGSQRQQLIAQISALVDTFFDVERDKIAQILGYEDYENFLADREND